jgi:oxepin-CoA hydrolase/3-oxo-5,6-dehydrosuberyl-CoA semialdehyde dehydrogenase
MVPEKYMEDVQIALGRELAKTPIGNPALKEVRMGALVGKDQVQEVRERIREIARTAEIVFGNPDLVEVIGADAAKGAFMSPVLLLEKEPFKNTAVHDVEAFGPVSTLIPYKTTEDAVTLSNPVLGIIHSFFEWVSAILPEELSVLPSREILLVIVEPVLQKPVTLFL